MKRQLEQRLAMVSDFDSPRPDLEQYRTPADLAAHVLTVATLNDDVADRVVLDLGSGTGMLAIGAALLEPDRVLGLEVDPDALSLAVDNEAVVDPPIPIEWIQADATSPPICRTDLTVVANPPFGAQTTNRNADRRFLETIAEVARVSYTIHNEGSHSFVESFVADRGGTVTHAFEAAISLSRQFSFHTDETRTIHSEVFRIEW